MRLSRPPRPPHRSRAGSSKSKTNCSGLLKRPSRRRSWRTPSTRKSSPATRPSRRKMCPTSANWRRTLRRCGHTSTAWARLRPHTVIWLAPTACAKSSAKTPSCSVSKPAKTRTIRWSSALSNGARRGFAWRRASSKTFRKTSRRTSRRPRLSYTTSISTSIDEWRRLDKFEDDLRS